MQDKDVRTLDISPVERVQRYKKFYGGCVSDALSGFGATDTVLSPDFFALRPDLILAGEALTVKLHSNAGEIITDEEKAAREKEYAEIGSPQKRMMKTVYPGCVLCYDTGGDTQPAHFGEMSCQLAKYHGCAGLIIAGNVRDTFYIKKMEDFPVVAMGTRPNAFGGWGITAIQQPIFLPGHLTHYVRVNPGDFIFGDTDGVQVIPKKFVDEVMLRCEAICETENEERRLIAEGMPIDEVYATYGDL
ncbi:MAG: RraA family protein [Planctomycetota bacterium]|jgi:regulator of RNase E activity RraA|nr:RraA family protein [Planctomycetota bacterium]